MANVFLPVNLLELRATYTTGGGPDKTILLSAEKHDKNIVNPVVVYLKDVRDKNFQIGQMAAGRGFKYIEVLDRSKIDIKSIIELNRIVRDNEIDLIHGHDYKTDILAYILSLLNPKVKLLSTAHGWITNTIKSSLYKWIHLRALRRFKNLIAVSKATKSLMVTSGIDTDKIKVIYNGIDENKWTKPEEPVDLRKEWKIPPNSFVVGTVGRIGDEKDYYSFLKIAKSASESKENIYFVIVGEGKEDEKNGLIDYASRLGIKDKVIFTGYRADLLNVYGAFDLFLMTSITEGLPNTMLEAMSMGLPVVSTDVGGISELVIDRETGYLFKVGDVKGITDKILELIENGAHREQISAAARKRIEDVFSFSKRLSIIERYYLEVTGRA